MLTASSIALLPNTGQLPGSRATTCAVRTVSTLSGQHLLWKLRSQQPQIDIRIVNAVIKDFPSYSSDKRFGSRVELLEKSDIAKYVEIHKNFGGLLLCTLRWV